MKSGGEKKGIKKNEKHTNELLNLRNVRLLVCVMESWRTLLSFCLAGTSVVLHIPCSTGIDYSQSLCRNYNRPENCVS